MSTISTHNHDLRLLPTPPPPPTSTTTTTTTTPTTYTSPIGEDKLADMLGHGTTFGTIIGVIEGVGVIVHHGGIETTLLWTEGVDYR